jgi:hypothetical protein
MEYVAADKMGAETVTYVSNICKYYIACTLIMQAREANELLDATPETAGILIGGLVGRSSSRSATSPSA